MFDEAVFTSVKNLHFIGIGGSGMFPIVQILHSRGYRITGSDNNESSIVQSEREMGIEVTIGQSAQNIRGAQYIIYTAAILEDNPELVAAKESGLPMSERAEVLGWLTKQYDSCCCVCGTHGKTTATSMITQILFESGLDPSAVIGGKLPAIGGYGRAGKTELMVCEACEFQDHFLKLAPDIAVILNIDNDHLEYFGTIENTISSFNRFAQMTSRTVFYNADDANTVKAVNGVDSSALVSFGLGEGCEWRAADIKTPGGSRSVFTLYHNGESLGQFTINVPGRHNVLNATAAIAACVTMGASVEQAREHLADFHGAGRRFEVLGERGGVTIADDYAHHPTEIAATLTAAKQLPYNAVWAVFQPFTYSRTKMLMDDFARSLSIADHVVMSEIMGSREKNTGGVYTSQLAEKIPDSVWFERFPQIARYVMERAKPGDLVITLGCGDVYKCAHQMLELESSI